MTWNTNLAEFILKGGEVAKNTQLSEDAQKAAFAKAPKLHELYLHELAVEKLLNQMTTWGIYINQATLTTVQKKLEAKKEQLAASLHSELTVENLNSPRQLGEALVAKYKLDLPKTKTGQYQTSVDALEKFTDIVAVAQILEYRTVDKILSTYIAPLFTLVDAESRVHPQYILTSAPTGRLAAKNPSIQSTPQVGEYGALVRQIFAAAPGNSLIGADYSQQELRILAHVSADANLKKAFEDNVDVHIHTASQILEIPYDQVTREQRNIGKVLNFGIVYGEGAYGLSRQLGRPVGECEKILKKYFVTYSGVKEYFDRFLAGAMEHGFVETLGGRVRAIPYKKIGESAKFLTGEQTRILKNYPIQGGAADQTKAAMLQLEKELLAKNPKVWLTAQIHDELIFEIQSANKKELETIAAQIKDIMQKAMPLSVPVVADVKIGATWADL